MRVLLVDDEPPARRRLARMLERCSDVEVVGEAADGVEALEAIRTLRPDLVLLDVRMPRMDGLAVAAAGEGLPPIVFTTAHDEHAVAAFDVSAVDYLLKPVNEERLRRALEKVRRLQDKPDPAQLESLLHEIASRGRPERLAARSGGRVHLFEAREIARLRASGKYVVFEREGREYVLDESLGELEARLADKGFVRVHRSELVNLDHVRTLHLSSEGARLELNDGQQAQISRRVLPELKRQLGLD